MFRRGNKCSQLNYLRSKTKLIRQHNTEAAVSRPGSLVMLSSLSSAVNVAKREEKRGGYHRADSSEALLIVLVKRRNSSWSHVCNEGVLCCNDSALSLSSASTMIWQFSDLDFLFEKSVRRDPSWSLVTNYPNCPLSSDPEAWCQDHHHHHYVTLLSSPWWMSPSWWWSGGATLSSGCTAIAGGRAGPLWLCFTELQVSWDSICSQALSYVTAPPPSSLFRLSLTTGCGFLWKTNSTIFQLELAKILALCKFCH